MTVDEYVAACEAGLLDPELEDWVKGDLRIMRRVIRNQGRVLPGDDVILRHLLDKGPHRVAPEDKPKPPKPVKPKQGNLF